MNDIILKNYTLISNPHAYASKDIFRIPDPNVDYVCSGTSYQDNVTSTGFDYIHKIVMSTRNHPEFLNILKEYLDKFPEKINCRNSKDWTALHLACQNSDQKSTNGTVEYLLNYPNIDVNLQNVDGNTALHMVCRYYNTDITEKMCELLLVQPGINVNLRDCRGQTALHIACQKHKIKLVELLLVKNI